MTKAINFILLVCLVLIYSCDGKSGYDHKDWIFVTGRYIGPEHCSSNQADVYHLIDVVTPGQMGDSIQYEGSAYLNVVKAKGINAELQNAGTLIGFDTRMSKQRVPSSCDLNPSQSFLLFEMQIINQIPIR